MSAETAAEAAATAGKRRRAPLTGLVAGHAVSLTGNMVTLIALPLYVLSETCSVAATGVAGAFATAPVVIGGALGGVVVDRLGYRQASIIADIVSGLTIAAVPLLEFTVGLPFWALLALVFASGVLDTPGRTARSALLPEAAEAAGVPLERAVGLFEATERGARLVGAPAAGLLVSAFGALTVLAIDAATFGVSAILVAALVARTFGLAEGQVEPDPSGGTGSGPGYWREFAAGVRFLAREPLLRAIVILVMVTNMFDAAKMGVLLPVVAEQELGGATAFGLLIGVSGGGALAGSLAFGIVGHRLPRRATFVTTFALASGPPFLALAAVPPLPMLIGVFAVSGIAAGAINPIISAVELERVPPGMRARVYGVIGAGCWTAMPLGALAAGFASSRFGTTATLITVGLAYFAVTLTPILGGSWRSMSRPRRRGAELVARTDPASA